MALTYTLSTETWELHVDPPTSVATLRFPAKTQGVLMPEDYVEIELSHDDLVELVTHLQHARHSIYVPPPPGSVIAPQPW